MPGDKIQKNSAFYNGKIVTATGEGVSALRIEQNNYVNVKFYYLGQEQQLVIVPHGEPEQVLNMSWEEVKKNFPYEIMTSREFQNRKAEAAKTKTVKKIKLEVNDTPQNSCTSSSATAHSDSEGDTTEEETEEDRIRNEKEYVLLVHKAEKKNWEGTQHLRKFSMTTRFQQRKAENLLDTQKPKSNKQSSP